MTVAISGDEQPTKSEIVRLFWEWNAALQSGEPQNVAKLYDDEKGVLVPTVSNKIRSNIDEIENYFANFLLLKPEGKILESHVSTEGPFAIHSGIYIFDMKANGRSVPARFSFVYRKNKDGEWKILSHHSSAMPEEGYEPVVA